MSLDVERGHGKYQKVSARSQERYNISLRVDGVDWRGERAEMGGGEEEEAEG